MRRERGEREEEREEIKRERQRKRERERDGIIRVHNAIECGQGEYLLE